MPYKDPERKRQWEREHRDQRRTQRRQRQLVVSDKPVPPKDSYPVSAKESGPGWSVLTMILVGVGSAVLGALMSLDSSGDGG